MIKELSGFVKLALVALFVIGSGFTALGFFSEPRRELLLFVGVNSLILTGVLFVVAIELVRSRRRIVSESNSIITRTEINRVHAAAAEIRELLDINRPLVWDNHWMISPDSLILCLDRLEDMTEPVIVECGSGISSIVFGYALKKKGGGMVYSLEHDDRYAERVEEMVQGHGLGDYVKVIRAALKPVEVDGRQMLWYDTAELYERLEGEINFVLVDGPPGSAQPLARYPAVPMLKPYLANGALIFVDDYAREDEQRIVAMWKKQFPQIEVVTEYEWLLKGGILLRKQIPEAGH